MTWEYEKYDRENGNVVSCPMNDDDGSITGNVVIGLKLFFDENPDFRISQGWTKHIHYSKEKDPDKYPDYNPQTQYLLMHRRQVDEYTIEDCYSVVDKSEEIMILEELLDGLEPRVGFIFN